MANRSQTTTGLSVYVYGGVGLHKVLTLLATVLIAKDNYVMFLENDDTVVGNFILP